MTFLRGLWTSARSALAWLLHGPDLHRPDEAATEFGSFRDPLRGRTIPFRLYAPASSREPAPVLLFSHGLGGSRDSAAYLGRALAQYGYFAFFLQHPGSDSALLAGARSPQEMRQRLEVAIRRPQSATERFGDVPAVIDRLGEMNRDGPLAGKLDLRRIAMAGHSFGARGTMAAAGQRMGVFGTRFKEPRLRAGVILSPSPPSGPSASRAYDAVDIPLLHITGTRDGRPIGGEDFYPSTRTLPFRLIRRPDQYLLVLDGATHSTFGQSDANAGDKIARRHAQIVAEATVLFLEAHLRGDPQALRRLREDFPRRLGPGDLFEFSSATCS